MSPNLFSRLLPSVTGSPSVYEAIQEYDRPTYRGNPATADSTDLDERNLREPFHDHDVERLLEEAADSRMASDRGAVSIQHASPPASLWVEHDKPTTEDGTVPKWWSTRAEAGKRPRRFDEEDDVPESLLLEHEQTGAPGGDRNITPPAVARLPSPVPTRQNRTSRVQWESPPRRQTSNIGKAPPSRLSNIPVLRGLKEVDPEQKAMWRWTNVENLDSFLEQVYGYYLGKGFWCIVVERVLNLLTTAFVVGMLTFLSFCVNYKEVRDHGSLDQVLIPQCTKRMSGFWNLLLWMLTFWWFWKLLQYCLDIPRLWHLKEFYLHLLGITDLEMQTISWQDIIGRLMNLRDANPRTALNINPRAQKFIGEHSKQRMDAHDIANRLMRRENYLIALFNKDILDVTLPIPILRNRQFFSKTLEWGINFSVMDFVFTEQGQVKKLFLKDTHRKELVEALKRRFKFAGWMNVVCAPFIIVYLLAVYTFRYFLEFRTSPSQLGSRGYTPLAQWKFREFNELWHLFERRIDMSYPFAARYVDQFPKYKTTLLARFVSFIAGALAAIFAIAYLINPDGYAYFEITPERTVLFYAGIFATIWTVARGLVPEENLVFDPEFAIQNVIDYTHYYPSHWKGRLHSDDVRKEFSTLYQVKVVTFFEEIMSIIFTPFILWFSLPNCSERLVDFFREFTIHVDGLGHVCSFALFDFKNAGDDTSGGPPNARARGKAENEDADARGLREDYYSTRDNKMLASYFSFIDSYANNARRGHQKTKPPGRRHFQPPPPFPGLAAEASEPPADERPASAGLAGAASASASVRHRSEQPSTSLLLDPHHQPHASVGASRVARSRHGPNAAARNRGALQTGIAEEPDEATETETEAPARGKARAQHAPASLPVSASTLLREEEEIESALGGSWKTTKAARTEESRAGDDGSVDAGEAGVLGLLYQFQRQQAEGRGMGAGAVGI